MTRKDPAPSRPAAAPHGPAWMPFLPPLLAAALYARSVGLGFALDDTVDLLENRFVTGPFDPVRILSSEFYGGWGHIASGHYRPLANLTNAVVAHVAGLRPAPFHLLNVVVFAAVVLLTGRLVARLSGDGGVGFVAALLVTVHPIVSESVAAIAGLKELAAAGLGLAALLVHVAGREEAWARAGEGAGRLMRPLAAGLLTLAALLYKETALAFVAAAVAAEFLHRRAPVERGIGRVARRIATGWPFFLAGATAFALRAAVTGGLFRPTVVYSIDNPLVTLPSGLRRIAAIGLVPRYLALVLWPACLSSDYSDGSFPLSASAADARVLVGFALVVALAGALVVAVKRGWRPAAFGLGVFGASYLLVSQLLVTIGTIFAERLFFVPFWGLAVALAAGAVAVRRRLAGGAARGLVVVGVVVLVALASRSWVRIGDWQDNASLTASAARCAPDNLKILAVRAESEARAGHRAEAARLLARAEAIRPGSSWVQAALGSFHLEEGDAAGAEPFLRACATGPEPIPGAVVSLAVLELERGRVDDALAAADRALAARPSFADAAAARLVRGEALLRRGDADGAEAEFRRALEEDPGEPAAHFNLGRIFESRGRWEAALAEFVAAEPRAPRERLPDILAARARAEEALGRRGEALRTRERMGAR